MKDSWENADAYENFMGRWSRPVAEKFLSWLDIPPDSSWLDVGCGTGSLTRRILHVHQPKQVVAIDPSEGFLSYARRTIANPLVHFKVGQAESLDLDSNTIDAVVSGLALNFVPQPMDALLEMIRVTRAGGRIGVYLWDFDDGIQLLTKFWEAAVALDYRAKDLDERFRFPICKQGKLESLYRDAGLKNIESLTIETETPFRNFNDFWQPFFGGVGPGPAYLMSLNQEDRQKLEHKLRSMLITDGIDKITLRARAWAVKATV